MLAAGERGRLWWQSSGTSRSGLRPMWLGQPRPQQRLLTTIKWPCPVTYCHNPESRRRRAAPGNASKSPSRCGWLWTGRQRNARAYRPLQASADGITPDEDLSYGVRAADRAASCHRRAGCLHPQRRRQPGARVPAAGADGLIPVAHAAAITASAPSRPAAPRLTRLDPVSPVTDPADARYLHL